MPDLIHEAQAVFVATQAFRRDFHQNPELGFQEFRTASVIAQELADLGLDARTSVGKTGVTAVIEGSRPGRVLLLRFDMDALPIQEETGAVYASKNAGVMHACGHDGHSAIGLSVARILHAHRQEFAGKVKLMFQPAEEGMGGAEAMLSDGVLEDPSVDMTLALHLWNEKSLGWLGITSGPVMAASDVFTIRVKGHGGHGAAPHLAIDPVLAAAQIITSLQSIVSRNVSPLRTAVVSVTSVHGGEAYNIIPQAVELRGTIRTFDSSIRDLVHVRFYQIVETVATAFGCHVDMDLRMLTPAVVNDAEITNLVQKTANDLFPEMQVETGFQTMGSEDMAYLMEKVPGCYFFIGSANAEKGLSAPHHHPRFDFDENALHVGVALMAASAMSLLR